MASKTILVTDDEPLILDLVNRILIGHDFRVLTAARAQEALDLCSTEAEPIDLVLTDIRMPGMDGRALARSLSESKPGVPILFMTGYASDTGLFRTLTTEPTLDGHAVIRKPFTPRELVNQIERLLSQTDSATA